MQAHVKLAELLLDEQMKLKEKKKDIDIQAERNTAALVEARKDCKRIKNQNTGSAGIMFILRRINILFMALKQEQILS